MTEPILLDTGPLVVVLSRRDPQHQKCSATLDGLKEAPITSWSVLTEAAWLLRKTRAGVATMFRMIVTQEIRIAAIDVEAIDYLSAVIARYESSRIDLADATLRYLAERHSCDTVITLDRRDFSIYRLRDGRALNLLPE